MSLRTESKYIMLIFAGVTIIFFTRCVGIISVDAHTLRSGKSKKAVIKEDCSVCGINTEDYEADVRGGSLAKSSTYPWMVSLRTHEDYNDCGGSIIDKFHILTAAHCVKDTNTGELLYKHEFYFQTPSRRKMRRGSAIEKIIIHPKYGVKNVEGGVLKIAKYDIALVKLKNQIKCDAYKNPICLPDADFKLSLRANSLIAGWSPPEQEQTIPNPPLRQGTLKHLNFEECIKAVAEAEPLKNHMLCAGGTKQTMCYGDSGGPLMQKIKNKYYVVGVASSETNETCRNSSPLLFTDVAKFIGWIHKEKKASSSLHKGGESLCFQFCFWEFKKENTGTKEEKA